MYPLDPNAESGSRGQVPTRTSAIASVGWKENCAYSESYMILSFSSEGSRGRKELLGDNSFSPVDNIDGSVISEDTQNLGIRSGLLTSIIARENNH